MKNLLYCTSFLLIALTLFSCDGRRIKGSGHITKVNRKLGSYNSVEVKGSMDVYLTQGPEQDAIIEADDNIIQYIELVEEGDKLVIRQKNHISISIRNDIKVRLTAPNVKSLGLAGSGNIKILNTLDNEDDVRMSVSGSGNIEGAVHAPELNVSVTGSGNVEVSGETRDLEVNIAGSGDFVGKSLLAENANVSIAGSGNADIHASLKLEGKIMGSGDINYVGNPEVSSKVMGSGSIHKRD